MINNAEQPEAANQQEQAPRGRAAMLSMYKSRNPETSDEPDDDTLFDWAGKGYTQHDELKGKYDSLNGSNEKLAAVVAEDPRFAKFMAMVAHGENLMYALGSVFGNILDELSAEDLAELRKGQEEFKQRFSTVKDNFNNYQSELKKFAADNGLDDAMVDQIDDAINDMADAFADRVIPVETIALVYKALNADNLIAEAEQVAEAELEAAKVQGSNEAIEAMKGKKIETSPVPDMVQNKGNKKNKMPRYEPKIVNMADDFKERD